MIRTTFTTREAAWYLERDPKSFARWADRHGVTRLRQQRIGRETVSVWATSDLTRLSRCSFDQCTGCVTSAAA